jgi:hypothetical protein
MDIPIWRLLTPESRSKLISYGPTAPPAITVRACAPEAALHTPLVKAVRIMIQRAITNDGLKLTPSGFLSRVDTMPVFDAVEWPVWSKESYAAVTKAINEREVTPIRLARVTAMKAGLLRRRGKLLAATKIGKMVVTEDKAGELLARLAEASFWKVRQEDFDGMPFGPWPQDHAGVALWSVGAAAWAWRDADELLPICTMPFVPVLGLAADFPKFAFFARILRPVIWLGLLDSERRIEPGDRWQVRKDFVRKTPLFDEVLRFDVDLAEAPNVVH